MNEIQDVIRLLRLYRKGLKHGTKRCEHCGVLHKANWKDYQRAEQVEGMIQKLSRWLEEDKAEKRDPTAKS